MQALHRMTSLEDYTAPTPTMITLCLTRSLNSSSFIHSFITQSFSSRAMYFSLYHISIQLSQANAIDKNNDRLVCYSSPMSMSNEQWEVCHEHALFRTLFMPSRFALTAFALLRFSRFVQFRATCFWLFWPITSQTTYLSFSSVKRILSWSSDVYLVHSFVVYRCFSFLYIYFSDTLTHLVWCARVGGWRLARSSLFVSSPFF